MKLKIANVKKSDSQMFPKLKHRRMKQAADVLRLEKETAEKMAAKAFAKSYLADLVPSVFNNLRENGYFYDPVERDVETGFMPWLMAETVDELDRQSLARLLLDGLIREVVVKRADDYDRLAETLKENDQQESEPALNRDESMVLAEDEVINADQEVESQSRQVDQEAPGDDQLAESNQYDDVRKKKPS